MHDRGAAPAKGAGAVGAAVGHAAPKAHQITHQRDTLIAQHITHYAENPKLHARALKQLGLNGQQLRAVHKNQVTSTRGIKPHNAGQLLQSSLGNFTGVKLLDKTLADLGEAGLYAAPGTVIAARHPIRAAKQTVEGIKRDVEHPLRHPGYTGLDAFAALSLGAGGVARAGAAGRALAEGEGVARAVARKSHEGGSLLHAPPPGEATLKVGDATVTKPLSRNALVRQAQKARYARKQVQLDQTAGTLREKSPSLPGRVMEKHGSAENTFGNRLRTQRRLEQSGPEGKGGLEYMRRTVKRIPRSQRRSSYAAMRVVGIEGDRALTHPAEIIGRHIGKHEEWASGGDAAAHAGVIRDLKLAQRVLEHPSEKFLTALNAVRDIANHGERESIARGFLTEKGADARKAAIARDYSHSTPQGDTFAVGLRDARAALQKSDRNYKPAEIDKGLAAAERMRTLYARDPEKFLQYVTRATGRSHDFGKTVRQSIDRARTAATPATIDKAPEGSFYFHTGKARDVQQPGRIWNARPGKYGVRPAEPGRYDPGLTQRYTGKGIKRAYVPLDIPRAVEHSFSRRIVLHSRHDVYQTLKGASTETRESRYQFPLPIGKNVSSELRRYLAAVEENVHASPDELQSLTHEMAERLKQEMEAKHLAHQPLGAKIAGVRWVDERFLKDLGETSMRGAVERVADAVNNPIRAGTLYLRPAYLLNALGNAAMLAPEGPAAAGALWRAARSEADHGARITAYRDAAMGGGRALGQIVHTGFLHKAPEHLAQAWNTVTDLHMRRAAQILEERRAGFRTREQVARLYTDPKLAPKLREITERARGHLGDYENLSPAERNTIRRLIYFYPWLKVATHWTAHMVREHPVESAILSQNGKVEAEHVRKVLGLLPQWARLSGLVPVGKKAQGIIDTVNPSSINTPSTVVQAGADAAGTARGLIGLKAKGTAGIGDIATPFLHSIITAGGQSDNANQRTGLLGEIEATPLASALRRGGVYGHPSKTYPATGTGAALGPLGAGGLYPRETSVDQLNKSGKIEQRATMSPQARVAADFLDFRRQARTVLSQHGVKMPREYAARLNLWQERASARAQAGHTWEAHIEADLRVIYRHGWIDRQQYAAAKANIVKAPKEKRGAISSGLTREYFDRDGILHQGAKEMGLKLP